MIWTWFKDDWLITRQAAKLFAISTALVLALTPVFLGRVDTLRMSFWARLPWGMLGILGPIALFFLWFGMWRYWVRIDCSGMWTKRMWFVVLLVGFWWGSCLYWPDRPAKSGQSEVPGVASQIGHDRQFRTTDRGRSNKDNAVQGKDRAVEEATTAAAFLLKTKPGPEWEAIGIHLPVGGAAFKASWRAWYAANESRAVDSLVWLMEEFIQKCQATGIAVPPPFFTAKRKLEREEARYADSCEDKSADATRGPAVQI